MSDQHSFVHKIMGLLRKVMPHNDQGENDRAVRMFNRMLKARDFFDRQQHYLDRAWPVTSGDYIIGNPEGSVAICTLTSAELMKPLVTNNRVAIAGRLVTVNLGIEKIIRNIISNPNIRYLLVCGKDSPVFHTVQGLNCLFQNGVDHEKRIMDAAGHYPVLRNISLEQIELFRKQCEFIDYAGELDLTHINVEITALSDKKVQPLSRSNLLQSRKNEMETESSFKKLKPGGQRDPLVNDPNGFFVITLDRAADEIVVRHYLPDNTPAHEMRGRRAGSVLLGLMRENLISQMSHAGYLGIELAKAETALSLGLPYEQDHPIRKK